MSQKNQSIRIRLLFYIIIASSMITFVFILLLLWADLKDNLRVADSQVEQMEETVVPALKSSLWKFDESQIKISMKSLLSLPNVIHVELNWNETQTGIHRIEMGEKQNKIYSDNAIRQHDLVIKGNNEKEYYLGELILTTSEEIAYNNLYKSALYIILLQCLKTLLISAIILFIIRQVLTRHILDIANQSRKIKLSSLGGVFSLNRKNNGNVDIDNQVKDELDEVVNALNQMRLRIKEGVDQKQLTESALALEIENSREKEKLAFAAKKSDEDKSLFLASISHEIRTPMNTIMGFTNLLKNADLKENERRYLNYIDKSAHSLLLLINNILDISKLDVGMADLESIPFYFEDLIEMGIATFSRQAKEKSLLFDFTVDESVPQRVWGDQNRLQQVLNNLISNALKFTHEGHVNIHISCLDSSSVFDGENERHEVCLQFVVTDTGVGIDPDYLPRIFDVFSQEDASTTRRYGGTGLGMSIVHKLVKLMGGDITVESRTGTTVKFTLPFSVCSDSDDATIPLDKQQATEYDLSSYHILVADDVEMNRALMVSMLESMGAKVSVADNGRTAVEKANQVEYDLLLMDIQMPEMNGFEVARTIRQQNDEVSKMPIIALTANVMDGVKEQCIEAGMNDFLGKPFEPNTLYEKVQRCLSLAVKPSQRMPLEKTREGEILGTLPGINILKGMKRWPNNQSEYFSHLLKFLDEIKNSRKEIDAYLETSSLQNNDQENKPLQALKKFVHRITGSAAFLALDNLSAAAATIEKTIFESGKVTNLMLERYSNAVIEVLANQQQIENYNRDGDNDENSDC
ncbi:MAG: response regulator [Pseudomonadales bacterium]|nr:response regulator [Pseudomonadales bacterium]